jgi:hypothetical protein
MGTNGGSEVLFLIWRDPESRAQHKVGQLWFDGFHYCFQYDGPGVASARIRGFSLLAAFPDVDKRYESVELFPALMHRLPDAKRPDYKAVLDRFQLEPGAHPFEVLRRTGGRLATDQLSFEEAPEQTPRGQSFQCFVAGWRFYEGDSILSELRPGTGVVLERDVSNPHDANAVVVLSISGRKLGYIPAYHSELTASALAAGRPVRASIVQVNPPPASTNERARIRVEVSIL